MVGMASARESSRKVLVAEPDSATRRDIRLACEQDGYQVVEADSGAEAQFVAKINNIRAQNGLAPLAVYGELRGVARNWTDQMVANGGISHNPNLANEVSANWTKLGENGGDHFGYSLASGGNINDAIGNLDNAHNEDLVVGAPAYTPVSRSDR